MKKQTKEKTAASTTSTQLETAKEPKTLKSNDGGYIWIV